MNSRMEKYYKDDTLPRRSTKNQQLYDSMYDDTDYNEVSITPKARTIDIEELREMINNNKKQVQRRKLENVNFDEEDKSYDLNDAIEQARYNKVDDDRKRSISNTQYDILKGIKLKNNDSDDLNDVLDTISTKNLLGDDLDLFDNLKSLDDTTVGIPTEMDIKKEQTSQMDDSFFTKSMKLTPNDFENINSGLEQNNKLMRIMFILIVVLIVIVLGIIIVLIK